MADILHRDLVDSELHETKGIAAAIVGDILVADGVGSGVWQASSTIIDVEEAPSDGYLYARQNAVWVIAPSDPRVLHYKADTGSQTPPPTTKTLAWDQASQGAATELFLSTQDASGRDVGGAIAFTQVGDTISILDALDFGHYQDWTITTITDNGNYYTFGVTLIAAVGGDFTNGLEISAIRTPAVVAAFEEIGAAGGADEGKSYVVGPAGNGVEREFRSTYGTDSYYFEVLPASNEAAMVFHNHMTYNDTFEPGDYDVTISFATGTTVDNKTSQYRVQLDAVDVVSPLPWSGTTLLPVSFSRRIPLSGSQTFTIDYGPTMGATTAFMYDATLTIVKV